MMRLLKKYGLFILFVYLTICTMLASTPVNELVDFPRLVQQGITLALYLPFFCVILWKLAEDLRSFQVNAFNVLYYVFALYYGALTVWRFATHAEVKEGIYYSVVLFGAFAICALCRDKEWKLDLAQCRSNLIAIGVYTVIFKLVFTFLEGNVFSNPPVNNLYSTSVLVLLLPFLSQELRSAANRKTAGFFALTSFSIALILICSSRAVVLLAIAVMAVLLITALVPPRALIRYLCALVSAALIVILLASFRVGEVQFSFYRALGVPVPTISFDTGSTDAGESEKTEAEEKEKAEVVYNAGVQVDKSDSMRSVLMQQGLAEFKENPLFGTGDLYYTYDLGYKTMEQTAHNFLLECLVCYGLVGTVLVLLLLLALLWSCGFFRKESLGLWRSWLSVLLVLFYYFAFGMVQPSVFNTLVCPTFAIVMVYYGQLLWPEGERKPEKNITFLKVGKDPENGIKK